MSENLELPKIELPDFKNDIRFAYVYSCLRATLDSICDYSKEALLDRMKFLVAVIEQDAVGLEQYGRTCLKEQSEQYTEVFGDHKEEIIQ
jgi:hypothetical protein